MVRDVALRGIDVGKGVGDRLHEGRPAISMCGLVVVERDRLCLGETKLHRWLMRESVHRVPIPG